MSTPPTTAGEQLTLAAMPRRLLRCTPSRLAAFDCPRRYRMTYLDRPAPPRGAPWAHNTVGAAVHVALARWWDQPPGRRTAAHGAALVTEAWQHDGFRDPDQSARWRTRAGGWVRDYLTRAIAAARETPTSTTVGDAAGDIAARADAASHDAAADDEARSVPPLDAMRAPLGVERTVAASTAGLALSGRIDRLDDRDGQLVVVDYKTGRRAPTDDDARVSPALALYALAAGRTMRRRCSRVELHHLPTGTIAVAEHSAQSIARHVERAEATAHDIVAATDTLAAGADPDDVFPTNPGPGCTWCDLRRHCPDGQRASTSRSSWDALDEPPA